MFQYGSMDLNSHNNNQKYIIFFYVYSGCYFRFYVYSHAVSQKGFLA